MDKEVLPCLLTWSFQAPDIPNIPPGNKDDGQSYLAFLKVLKGLLPDKSVSIAAPSSYWYLKNFPIEEISQVVDYIVFMTYDLHGQVSLPDSFCIEELDTEILPLSGTQTTSMHRMGARRGGVSEAT